METNCKELIAKSEANWSLALGLKDDGQYNAAANRFYYSVFQIVKVYAIKIGEMTLEEQTGVHAKARNIVRKDDKKLGRIYGTAEEIRVTADYLLEDVSKNDLDSTFVKDIQDLRDHYKKLVA